MAKLNGKDMILIGLKGEKGDSGSSRINMFNGYISAQGTLSEQTNDNYERSTDFISVEAGEEWSISIRVEIGKTGTEGVWFGYALYDKDKNFINREIKRVADTIIDDLYCAKLSFTIPDGAAYVRFTGRTWNAARYKIEHAGKWFIAVNDPFDDTQENGTGTQSKWTDLYINGTNLLYPDFFNSANGNVSYLNRTFYSNAFHEQTSRIMTDKGFKFPFPVTVSAKQGYWVGVMIWTSEILSSNSFVADWGWNSAHVVPANTYFSIVLRNDSNTDIEVGTELDMFEVSANIGSLVDIYAMKGLDTSVYPFSCNGERINVDKQMYRATSLGFGTHGWVSQGMAIHNGIAFNMSGNKGKCYLYDLNERSLINSYEMTIGHGSSACFSNEYYESTDEFPLLYVNDCYTPKVYINRVTREGATLIKTLYFGTNAEIGYYTAHAFDVTNKRLYMLAYAQNSLYDTVDNSMIFSIWDMANLTQNGDGTYTPMLIEKTNMNTIQFTQDIKFFDGKIVVMSSSDIGRDTIIYFINPVTKLITTTMTDFIDDFKLDEIEGFDFVLNESTGKYEIVCSPVHNDFYKIEFV